MIVRLQGKDLHLTTELYDNVIRELEPSVQFLHGAACHPLMMDVVLEIADRGTAEDPEDAPYRVAVYVSTTDGQVSASATSDGLSDAVTDVAEHLRHEVDQFCRSPAHPRGKLRASSADGIESHRNESAPFAASVDGPFSGEGVPLR